MEFSTIINRYPIPDNTLLDSRYQIQHVLGKGGLGRTYLALDNRRFDERCVLKELCPNTAEKSFIEKAHELFEREAKILYKLNHPQIPKFHAWFEVDNRLFLVQDYVKGQNYKELLSERQQKNQFFSEAEIIQWFKHLLPVLSYIHHQNIIHRDISPDNIMLPCEGGLPVLIDFGVVKSIEDTLNPLSAEKRGSIVGKLGYSPPEQMRSGLCFPNSDLYALGVTAIVLLTGQTTQLLLNPDTLKWDWCSFVSLSPLLTKILEKLLTENPKDRYQNALEVLSDLNQPSSTQSPTLPPTVIRSLKKLDPTLPKTVIHSPQKLEPTLPPTIVHSPQKLDLERSFILEKILIFGKQNAIALGGLCTLALVGAIVWIQTPHIPFFCNLLGNCAATQQKNPEPPLW